MTTAMAFDSLSLRRRHAAARPRRLGSSRAAPWPASVSGCRGPRVAARPDARQELHPTVSGDGTGTEASARGPGVLRRHCAVGRACDSRPACAGRHRRSYVELDRLGRESGRPSRPQARRPREPPQPPTARQAPPRSPSAPGCDAMRRLLLACPVLVLAAARCLAPRSRRARRPSVEPGVGVLAAAPARPRWCAAFDPPSSAWGPRPPRRRPRSARSASRSGPRGRARSRSSARSPGWGSSSSTTARPGRRTSRCWPSVRRGAAGRRGRGDRPPRSGPGPTACRGVCLHWGLIAGADLPRPARPRRRRRARCGCSRSTGLSVRPRCRSTRSVAGPGRRGSRPSGVPSRCRSSCDRVESL